MFVCFEIRLYINNSKYKEQLYIFINIIIMSLKEKEVEFLGFLNK